MVKPILALVALLTASCGPLAVSGAGSRPADLFSFVSDHNDYIGLGRSKSFTAADSKFVVEPGTTREYLQLVVERGDEYWSIDMASPSGQPLEIGTYENAAKPEFRNDKTPVLMVYGEGRACDSSGSFTIKQIAFDQEGHLLALQATFLQRCASPVSGDFRGTLAFGKSQ
jgi:hypothetical protein